MNVRLGLKALDFIREIDFSLIGKEGRVGGGEKEISNKNVPRPLIHEFSFCLLSLNNFPLTFLIEYCKWKKQINISPWPDVLSVMLFMILFCSVSEREGASSTARCQSGQTLRCISVQSRQEKKLCFTFILPRLETDVGAKCTLKLVNGCQRLAFCHHILHSLSSAAPPLFCKVGRVFWSPPFSPEDLHSCNEQGRLFNFQSVFY